MGDARSSFRTDQKAYPRNKHRCDLLAQRCYLSTLINEGARTRLDQTFTLLVLEEVAVGGISGDTAEADP
jgi:hypothetical protein